MSQHHHLLVTVAAISALNASEAGLDPVALSALVSFMAIALPLISPGGITGLGGGGSGHGVCEVHDEVACVSSMVLQIDNLYMLYIRVLLVFTLTARCRRKMTDGVSNENERYKFRDQTHVL
ncbi:hypothetical protein D0Y65_046294 [Glycine soja]|uniref:Uncharacterized protein n=1 Tax=Glycine soja TaxID=3848 RepID=A0A445G8R0_GLYSO|nr:hypothetical protein D0Y65_046294 [Glycine soja]